MFVHSYHLSALLLLVACDFESAAAAGTVVLAADRAESVHGVAMGFAGTALQEPLDLLPAVVCADGPTVQGIDVSYWQGTINWAAVAGDGIQFAFIRAADGTTYIDEKFEPNWAGAQENGLLVGAYQFFRPSQDPIAQAEILLGKMGAFGPGMLPPVIDVETAEGMSPAEVSERVAQWVDHVEAATGVMPIVYTGKFIWEGQVGSAEWADHPLWIAQYGVECPDLPVQWSDWAFFQTSSTGSVAGIGGNVDMNLWNGDYADLEALAGGGGADTCGDGKCVGNEDSDTCPADCPPCGMIGAEGGIIDDIDACFHTFGNADYWYDEASGYGDALIWTHAVDSANPDNYGIWELIFDEAGVYQVEVYVAAFAQSQKSVYLLTDADSEIELAVDQSAGGEWVDLGEYEFQAGAHGQQVRLNDNTGEPFAEMRSLVFDAIRLTRVDAPGTTTGGTDSGGTDSEGTDSEGTDSGGTDSEGTDSGGTDSGAETGAAGSESAGSSGGDDASDSASAGESGVTDSPEESDACACSSDPRPGSSVFLGLVVLLGRRRRSAENSA